MKAELLHTFVADARNAPVIVRLADGSVLTGGFDGHLRRWDTTHWIELEAVDAHGRGVRDLDARAADGAAPWLSVGGDRTLRAWRDGRALYAISRRVGVRVGPDDRLAAISSRGRVCIHALQTGQELTRLPTVEPRAHCIGWSPDGRAILAGGDGVVHRLEIADEALSASLPVGAGPVADLDVAPGDAGFAAVAADSTVAAWDPAGAPRWQVAADGAVPHALRFSPDGSSLALSLAYMIQIRRVADGALQCEIKSRIKGLFGLAWSADGRRVMCGAADGRVRVWALEGQ